MSIIKSYTSFEQSKKLAEFLPIESADMNWISIDNDESFNGNWEVLPKESSLIAKDDKAIPCWSLTALLNVTSKPIVMNKVEGNGKYIFSSSYMGTYTTAQNPIDACVDMIEKLHELNLL